MPDYHNHNNLTAETKVGTLITKLGTFNKDYVKEYIIFVTLTLILQKLCDQNI